MLPPNIGRLEPREKISETERAIVYRAYDPQLQRDVVAKVLKTNFLYTLTSEEKFKNACDPLIHINHPNLVPLYDYGDEDNSPYFVMPLYKEKTLRERLAEGALSAVEVIELLTPIAEALDQAAERGIVHMNIKPSNILFDEMGVPYLSELGHIQAMHAISVVRDQHENPQYTSPEQVRKRKMDARSHVYSLGAMAFHMLTGQQMYPSASDMVAMFKHTSERPRSPRSLNPSVEKAVADVVLKAVEKDPEDRYPTAAAFVRAMHRALNGEPDDFEAITPAYEAYERDEDAFEQNMFPYEETASSPKSPVGNVSQGRMVMIIAGIVSSLALAVGICAFGIFWVANQESADSRIVGTLLPPVTTAVVDTAATETAIAEDARTVLRQAREWPLLIEDNFDDNANEWQDGEESGDYADISWQFTDGTYLWQSIAKQGFVWRVWPSMEAARDMYVGVDVELREGVPNTQFGVIFRNDDDQERYYYAELRDSGYFRFFAWKDGEWNTIIDDTRVEALEAGQSNRLEVVARGTRFWFFVNGSYIASAQDSRIASGDAGLIIGNSEGGEQSIVVFDNFVVRAAAETEPTLKTTPAPLQKDAP